MNFDLNLESLSDTILQRYNASPFIPHWNVVEQDNSLTIVEKMMMNGLIAVCDGRSSAVVDWDIVTEKGKYAKIAGYCAMLLIAKGRIAMKQVDDTHFIIVVIEPDAAQFPPIAQIIQKTLGVTSS